MKFNKDILPKWWSIVVWITILLFTQGCYTQLSMFHPEPEIENDDSEEFYSYSVARVRPNISLHAQGGAGQSLGMAYQMMYNRFAGFMGFGNRYSYYNPYYYGGYYNDFITVEGGTYSVWIPGIKEHKPRLWTTDRDGNTNYPNTPKTKLRVTRTRTNTTNRVSDPYPVQDTPRQDTFNSQRPNNSSGGTRATRRN